MLTRFERPEPKEVTKDLTAYLQGMALYGWRKTVPGRNLTERMCQFNPYHDDHIRETRRVYKKFAAQEGLLLGYTEDSADPAAFALTTNDVSGNLAVQAYKRWRRPEKVYALIRHACIAPDHQGQGNSKPLISEALRSPGFRPEQVPTAYIFDENQTAIRAFTKIGFVPTPPDQEPKVIEDYFGSDEPVLQRRYAASSIEAVLEVARA